MARYQVTVGNVGNVYDGSSIVEACKVFSEYRLDSARGLGRVGGEEVTLMELQGSVEGGDLMGDILETYSPSSPEDDDNPEWDYVPTIH